MKKLLILLTFALLCSSLMAQTGRVKHDLQIRDEYNDTADVTAIYIYLPDSTTNATIYQDNAGTIAITQPITSSSTNTTLSNSTIYWYGPDGFDYKLTTANLTQTSFDGPLLNASSNVIKMNTASALDNELWALSQLTSDANELPYFTGPGTASSINLYQWAIDFLADVNTIDARAELGVAIGSDVQAYDPNLTAIASLTPTNSYFIVGDGNDWITESGATARTSLGLGTIATQDANAVAITGGTITGITDLVVADGGTGVSTLADGGLVIGNAGSAVDVVAAGATTEILVGGGATTAPVWTTATGTGAPVRAGTPTLTTPVIGAATGTSLDLTGNLDAEGIAELGNDTNNITVSAEGALIPTGDGYVSGVRSFDVRDYGAVPDDAVDDEAAITSAIEDANDAGGGTVFFPAGTYALDSNTTVWTAVTLEFAPGASLMGITGNETIAINGGIVNTAHQIFQSTITVGGIPNVDKFNVLWWGATPGDATDNDATAIQAAVDSIGTTGGVVYIPTGVYKVTSTILIDENRTHIRGDGYGATEIDFEPDVDDVCFQFEADDNGSLDQCSMRGVTFWSSDTTYLKTAVHLIDVSIFTMDGTGTMFPHWKGADSIFLDINGRDHTTITDMLASADFPIVIGTIDSPHTPSGVSIDHFNFNDCYLVGNGNPLVSIETGVLLSQVSFTGRQSWVAGTHGLYWVDTTSAGVSNGLRISNVRSEGVDATTNNLVYIDHNTGLQGFQWTGGQSGGMKGFYLRNVENVLIDSFYYTGTYEVMNVDSTVKRIDIRNCFWQSASTATMGGQKMVFGTPLNPNTGGLPPNAIYDETANAIEITTIDSLYVPTSTQLGNDTNNVTVSAEGAMTLNGDGRVTQYEWIPAQGLAAHGTKVASWVTFANAITSGWEFANNSDNAITFSMKIPADIDFTEASYICVGWSSPVVSGDCYWEVEYLLTDEGTDTDAVADANNGALYDSADAADEMVRDNLITIAANTFDTNSLCLHGAITRDVSKDALGGVAHLHGVTLMYTKNRFGDTL